MNIGIPLYVNPVEVKVCCGFPSVVMKGYRLLWTMSTLNLLSFVRCPTLFCGDLFELFYSIAEAISPEAFVQGEDDQGCDGARSMAPEPSVTCSIMALTLSAGASFIEAISWSAPPGVGVVVRVLGRDLMPAPV